MFNKYSKVLACNCCGKFPEGGIDQNLVDILNEACISEERINCAYRCPDHNAEVGGEPNSQHLYGTAADVDANDVESLAEFFEELGADGVGRYENFVHVDVRSGRVGDLYRW